jgi:hypothetical protein
MDTVDSNRAGTASGINNAVARVAALLAVAILGIAMVSAFSYRMNQSLKQLNLPADVTHSLQSNEIKLAALPIPAGMDSSTAAALRTSIDRAFVSGFRLIMLICASLAVASAGFAWRMITMRAL